MPAVSSILAECCSAAETASLARRLGLALDGEEVLALFGPLGGGKTTFAKGLAEGLGIDPRDVTSPTFLLVHELLGRHLLVHVDAYRISDPGEIEELGLGERLGESVVLVEWAEKVLDLLPEDHLEIWFSEGSGPDDRTIRFESTGPAHARLLAVLATPGEEAKP